MDLDDQKFKYNRELLTISFSILPGKSREIEISVIHINDEYQIRINENSKSLSIDNDYKLYTYNMDIVVDLVMSYTELKDNGKVNLHADLWTPLTEEQTQNSMLSISMQNLVYPEAKSYV